MAPHARALSSASYTAPGRSLLEQPGSAGQHSVVSVTGRDVHPGTVYPTNHLTIHPTNQQALTMISSAQQYQQTHFGHTGRRGQPDLSLGSRLPRQASSPQWAFSGQPLPQALHNALVVMGVVAVLSLTATFARVVQGGTEQAQARHRHNAELAEMAWRCNALTDLSQQALCKGRIGQADGSAGVKAPGDTSQQWALATNGLASR